MKLPLMPREELLKKARPVVNSLSGLSARDALRVLSVTSELILEQCTEDDGSELSKQVKNKGPNLLPNTSWVFKIDKDPEIKKFILSYEKPTTQVDLIQILIKKFGKERSPSRSGLSRYLKAITGTSISKDEMERQ